MKAKMRQFGFSLVEMLVVIAIISVMIGVAALNAGDILRTQRISSARNLIRNSLAQAQAYAQTNRKYAGLRFQFDRNGWSAGRQYMVLIEKVPESVTAYEFNPIPNSKPLALPKNIGVITLPLDLQLLTEDQWLDDDPTLDGSDVLAGSTTFSIIFSPTGQLVVKDVNLKERFVNDPVVNTLADVNLGVSLLYRDTWAGAGEADWCVKEPSALDLFICETSQLRDTNPDLRYTNYVADLEPILINVYTGTFIED
ncbi:MAG: prepilin-type N-terminal cleavage/methylation domain-containing protein [Sedimentisphaerales bacterium]|nr:prepilin-type N-terminal cleavage/methylation domain-containing protein [Sedimentisphaerales bacterium]